MQGYTRSILLRFATLVVVGALTVPVAADGAVDAGPWGFPGGGGIAHTNQDGPDIGHTNQDGWLPPNFDMPPDEGPDLGITGRDAEGGQPFDDPFDGVDEQMALAPGSHKLPQAVLQIGRGPSLDMMPSLSGAAIVLEGLGDLTGDLTTMPHGGGTVSPVPTPGALSLLGLSILTLAGRRRRR